MPRKRDPYSPDQLLGPAPKASLLGTAGKTVLGGLEATGNVLGLPGSMVLDTVTGNNPFDQLLTPFSGDNRTTGRDALRQFGLAGKEDTWGNWGAGLGVDIATDPLTWLTLFGGAAGKAGRLAKSASLWHDAPEAMARAAGKAAGAVGSHEARVTGTLRHLVEHADDPIGAMEKLRRAHTGSGLKTPLEDLMNEPLGGMARFWPTDTMLGTGKYGQMAAKGLDQLGNSIMHFGGAKTTTAAHAASQMPPSPANQAAAAMPPGVGQNEPLTFDVVPTPTAPPPPRLGGLPRAGARPSPVPGGIMEIGDQLPPPPPNGPAGVSGLPAVPGPAFQSQFPPAFSEKPGFKPVAEMTNLLNQPMHGATSPVVRALSGGAERVLDAKRAEANSAVAKLSAALFKGSLAGEEHADKIRWAFEDKTGAAMAAMPAEFREVATQIQGHLKQFVDLMQEDGLDVEKWTDTISEWFPRYMTNEAAKLGGGAIGGAERSGVHAGFLGRAEWTHEIKGGTPTLNTISKDPRLSALLDHVGLAESGADKGFTIADYLRHTYGPSGSDVLPAEFISNEQAQRLAALGLPKTAAAASHIYNNPKQYADALEQLGVTAAAFRPKDTFAAAAETLSGLPPELRRAGLFGNHPLSDLHRYLLGTAAVESNKDLVWKTLLQPGLLQPVNDAARVTGSKSLRNLFEEIGFHKGRSGELLRKKLVESGVEVADDADMLGLRVPNAVARDLVRRKEGFKAPETVSTLGKFADDWTNIIKQFLTGTVKFQVRNIAGGTVSNILNHQFSLASMFTMSRLLSGPVIEGASKKPYVLAQAAKEGLQNIDDKTATEIIARILFGREVTGSMDTAVGDVTGQAAQGLKGGTLRAIASQIPGQEPFDWGRHFWEVLMGKHGNTWNPLKAEFRGSRGADKTTFAPLAALNNAGHWVESVLRGAPMLYLLEQGVDPAEAARRVGEAQVKYDSRHYTSFEKSILGRLFPFFKYAKGMGQSVARQLTEEPGGPLGQTLRVLNRSRGEDELTPEYIQDTASIPMGTLPDGSNRYLTGLGMPFEDPLSFATPSPRAIGMEALGRLNPLLKVPLEWTIGQSLFQKGIGGSGRPLEDLDPPIGRIMANIAKVGGRKSDAPVRYPGSNVFEHLAAGSPLSPAINIARTATDPRKGLGAKAVNLLTGVHLTDVSPASQDRILRERIGSIEKKLGAKTYSETFVPKDIQASLSGSELATLNQLKELRRLLEARMKARKVK